MNIFGSLFGNRPKTEPVSMEVPSSGDGPLFLKITNKGKVSRKYFELIGAGNKRERWEDASVIGNKGSGAKLAVVPILRLGLEVAVSSSDSSGAYILRYGTEEADLGDRITRQIVFKYDGSDSFPSQLTIDAFRDWDKPVGDDGMKVFKALREYICNAWDEDKQFTLEVVNEIHQAAAGTTSAFLTITDEIREILASSTRYFKILGGCDPLAENSSGAIYPKSQPGVTRLFSQGVLVDCKEGEWQSTAFDYSLNGKQLLSEERIIKDFMAFVDVIGSLLSAIDNPGIVVNLFSSTAKNEARLEVHALERIKYVPPQTAKIWKTAWQLHFGRSGCKAVISGHNKQIDMDAENRGFTPIYNLPAGLEEFLKRCGITCAADVVPRVSENKEEKPAFVLIELDREQQSWFNGAYSIFLRYYPQAKEFPVFFYRPTDYRMKGTGGHCGNGDRQYKEIWISEESLGSVSEILTALTHEGRHCLKKAGDYDRAFNQEADYQLVALMLTNPVPPHKNEWRAEVVQQRGILVPHRFIGQNVHVLVNGKEMRFKFGEGETSCQMSASFPAGIKGVVGQNRRVTGFRRFGCVFLPENILKQLPSSVVLEIR